MPKSLKFSAAIAAFLVVSCGLEAQTPGSIRGTVTDPSAALVPSAAIQISGGGQTRTATSDEQGKYTIVLPAGNYSIRADSTGFVTFTKTDISVANGQPTTVDIALQISVDTQEVSVQEQAAGAVSTDPSSNVGALVLSSNDLDALPDDPDDLQNDLQALAGPAAGPNGAQFFVDGFSGGQLPPKSSIREIRVNSNPFSSEFDHPGFGRVEILTRPGADKYHGTAFANYGDRIFDSKNPFLNGEKPGYTTKMLEANVGGPLNQRTSFNLEFSRRLINENALVNATGIDSGYHITNFVGAYPTPNHFWSVNPRIDYAINRNNTLALRYQHNDGDNVGGVGGFNLPTQGTKSWNKNNQAQITETAVIGAKAIVETRVQIRDNHSSQIPLSTSGSPQVSVSGSFVTGGAPFISNYTFNRNYELQELLTLTEGAHTIKAGGRVRQDDISSKSTANYNGSYSFSLNTSLGLPQCLAGYTDGTPTALDLYTETTRLLDSGMKIADVQALGCGPTQFTQRSGPQVQNVRQLDLGLYVQDDWRFRPNLTISPGLRYETQNNIHDRTDFAPRVAVAWAPGGKGGKPSKTVIRGGWGMFYDRFSDNNVLNALRFSGSAGQQNYQLTASPQTPLPPSYPLAPPATALTSGVQQVLYSIDSNFNSPYMMQSAVSVERSLPGRTSLAVNLIDSRGVHVQRQRNINAPLPGTFNTPAAPNGILPYSGLGPIYLYEGSGIYKQTQVMTNVNSRLNSHLQLSGFYAWGKVNTNAGGFPMDQYNTSLDWGRAGYDSRHRAFISGTVGLPFKLTASPFVTMNSGAPFNITTGGNYNGNGLFNARPSFATAASNPKAVVVTNRGTFNLSPVPGETLIPYDLGVGPAQFSVNVRLARTWGFGERSGGAGGGMGGPGGAQMRGPAGGGGGGFGGGMRMPMGMGGTGSSGKKYNVTLSVNARNALNHVNLAQPSGVLTSSTFGTSTNISNGFGGGPFGGGNAGAAGNRRIEMQLRFQF